MSPFSLTYSVTSFKSDLNQLLMWRSIWTVNFKKDSSRTLYLKKKIASFIHSHTQLYSVKSEQSCLSEVGGHHGPPASLKLRRKLGPKDSLPNARSKASGRALACRPQRACALSFGWHWCSHLHLAQAAVCSVCLSAATPLSALARELGSRHLPDVEASRKVRWQLGTRPPSPCWNAVHPSHALGGCCFSPPEIKSLAKASKSKVSLIRGHRFKLSQGPIKTVFILHFEKLNRYIDMFPNPHNNKSNRVSHQGEPRRGFEGAGAARSREAGSATLCPRRPGCSGLPCTRPQGSDRNGTRRGQVHTQEKAIDGRSSGS